DRGVERKQLVCSAMSEISLITSPIEFAASALTSAIGPSPSWMHSVRTNLGKFCRNGLSKCVALPTRRARPERGRRRPCHGGRAPATRPASRLFLPYPPLVGGEQESDVLPVEGHGGPRTGQMSRGAPH